MGLAIAAILVGFALLVWSADRFVEGAAATARNLGMPMLLIGVLVVGFGTSAPEMVVSAMAALDGNPDLALGNALGSNIVNTGLILGLTALIAPIAVHSNLIRKELPLMLGIGVLLGYLLWDGSLSRWDGGLLLAGFFSLIAWSIVSAMRGKGDDALEQEVDSEMEGRDMNLKQGLFWLVAGLVLLVVSSRILVWGAVSIAEALGVSDLVIGLTIVALGTSLPELAASLVAARKGEHDIALGNIVGSNMFNILAVVGIAGSISPMASVAPEVLNRDWPAMIVLMVLLFAVAYGFRGQGRINRWEGAGLLLIFIAYNIYLVQSVLASTLS